MKPSRLTASVFWLTLLAHVSSAEPLASAASMAAFAANEPPVIETMPEDEPDPLGLLTQASRLRPRLRLIQDFVIDQDYDGAEVDTYTTALRASVDAPLNEKIAIRVVGSMEVRQFDFRGRSSFLDTGRAPDDPFEELFRNQFRFEGGYRFTENWALVGGGSFSSAWESGSNYADGIRGAGVLGVAYVLGERFSVVVGARVNSKLAGSGVSVGPFAQFRWRITDEIELASRGMGLKLAYRPRKGLTFFTQGEWRQNSFRLEDRGGTIGKGVLQNRTAPVVAGVSWKVSRHWRLRGWAGAEVYQKYTVRDHSRNKISSTIANEPAFTGRLDLLYRF